MKSLIRGFLIALIIAVTAGAASAETLMMPKRDALKGTTLVVWGVTTLANGTAFSLDYGDATAPTVGTVSDRSYIAFNHTYATSGNFTAKLTVGAENGTVAIQVFDSATLTAANLRSLGINMAIQNGLRFLWTAQSNRAGNFPASPTTSWPIDFTSAGTSLITLAFENHGYKLANDGSAPTGVYEKYIVRRGLNFVVGNLAPLTISSQASNFANQPVRNPCVGGVEASPCTGLHDTYSDTFHESYTTGIAMLPLAASGALNRTNTEVAGYTNGKTYGEILQRATNAVAWGQIDNNGCNGRGGWYYDFNDCSSDGSTIGWDLVAMLDAGAAGAVVPAWVNAEFAFALNSSLNTDGTLDYQSDGNPGNDNSVGPQKDGTGLMGLFFVGETTGARVAAVTNTISSWWPGISGTGGNSWGGCNNLNKGCAYTMFNNFKGMKLHGITTLPGVTRPAGPGTIVAGDWYADYQDWFVANQTSPTSTAGGQWSTMGWSCCDSGDSLTASIAELILSPVALVLPDADKFSTVGLSPATGSAVFGGTHTVIANAQSTGGGPVPGATVVFTVLTGPNAGESGSATTDATGHASFTYFDSLPGTDTIEATIGGTLNSNVVSMTWTTRPTTLTTVDASGSYGGTTLLRATLVDSSDHAPLSGRVITFTLNGSSVGTVITDSSGMATLNASLAGINANSYPSGVQANFAGDTSYDLSHASSVLNVNPIAASVTPNAATRVYGGVDPAFTGTLTGFLAADAVTASYSRVAGESVTGGPYAISATLSASATSGNYTVTYNTANFTITPKAASVTPDAATKVYGDVDPAFTGTLTGFLASDAVTATYSRTAGENVSGSPYVISAALSASATTGNYTITSNTANFTITPKAASVTPNAATKVYGDSDPALTGALAGFLASDAVTATYSRTAGETVNGGPYVISAALSASATTGNYAITSNTANFTITPKAASVTPNAATKVYGDSDPALTGTLSGFLAADSVTATYSRTAGETVAGSPYVISAALSAAASSGNYTVTSNTANFTITAKAVTVTAGSGTKVYGTSDPALTATSTGFLAADGITFSATRAAGESVGDYATTAVATGANLDNYNVTYVAGNFSITKAAATVTAGSGTKVYGTADPAMTATSTGFLAADGITASATRVAGELVGNYATTATAAGANVGNYNVTYVAGNFSITKGTVVVTAGSGTKVYGNTDPALGTTQTGLTAADVASVTLATTRAAGESVGNYTTAATATGAVLSNYNVSLVAGNFSVTSRPVTVTADAKTKVYGTADPALTYQVTSGSLAGTDSFTGSLTRVAGNTVGTYAILQGSVSLNSNYTLTYVGANLVITQAPTATVVVSSLNPSIFGQAVTFKATVTSTAGTPTGSVTFKDGATVLATVALTSGQASYTTAALLVGSHTITAVYGSDINFSGSTSPNLIQVVNQASTATTLTSSLNPSAVGAPVTFTSVVTAVAPGAGVPTGTITFTDGTTVLGTSPVNASGQATLTTSSLTVGIHPITATYNGDANFKVSASAPLSQLVYAFPAGPAGGDFVIGDLNSAIGTSVTFWGSQWAKSNSLSGGSAPSSFKGFADSKTGSAFIGDTGNSNEPNTLPAYIAVIVSSSVSQNKSTINGNVVRMVVVKTNAGYASDPGHAGTGTVVVVIP